jgi:hypothetical protein
MVYVSVPIPCAADIPGNRRDAMARANGRISLDIHADEGRFGVALIIEGRRRHARHGMELRTRLYPYPFQRVTTRDAVPCYGSVGTPGVMSQRRFSTDQKVNFSKGMPWTEHRRLSTTPPASFWPPDRPRPRSPLQHHAFDRNRLRSAPPAPP